jgi:hypothetical protein
MIIGMIKEAFQTEPDGKASKGVRGLTQRCDRYAGDDGRRLFPGLG